MEKLYEEGKIMLKKNVLPVFVLAALMILISVSVAWAAQPKGLDSMPEPIDPQSWMFSRDMTWDMWKDNTAFNWKTDGGKIMPQTVKKGLLVLCDFVDRPFVVCSPAGSEQMGNPLIGDIPKEDLVEFWESFLNDPKDTYNSGLNKGITISEFWQENTQGRWKIELDAVGVYTLPGFEFEYGLDTSMNHANDLPAGFTRRSGLNTLAINAAIADGVDLDPYDFAFILHSGSTESGGWEEAGYMMFFDETTIAYEYSAKFRIDQMKAAGITWANMAATDAWLAERPVPAKGEAGRGWWAKTRYVPWTSWWAAAAIWSSSGSISLPGRTFRLSQQGETNGNGVFSHEFGHISTIADNYGSSIEQRAYSGFWDLMCNGSMTGFGGNHTRYQIPNLQGGSIPAHMLTRTKRKLGFLDDNQLCNVNYAVLSSGTPVITEIYSRTTPVGDQFGAIYPELAAINDKVKAGRAALGLRLYNFRDSKGRVLSSADWESDTFNGANWYDNYTMEVIDQVGYDCHQSDHGVMICKNRETLSESVPYAWLINAHPGGLDTVDFYTPVGPNGEPSQPKPFRNNDSNHLSAALFHAGKSVTPNNYGVEAVRTGQGNDDYSIVLDGGGKPIPKSIADNTVNEYIDTYNNLHFYILDKIYSPGPYGDDILSYQVAVRHFDGQAVGGELVVTKGKFEPADPGRVATQWFSVKNTGAATDIVRIAVDCGLEFTLLNDLYAVDPDQTVEIPVYIKIPAADPEFKTLTFSAASETNAAKLGSVIISGFSAAICAPAQIFIKEGNRIDYVVSIANVADEGANLFTIEAAFDAKNLNYTGYSFGPSLIAYSPSQGDFSYDLENGKLILGMYLARPGLLLKAETETPLVTFHFTLKDGVPAGPGTTVIESFLSKVTGYCFIDGRSSPIDAIVVKPGAPVKVLIHPLGYEGGDLDEATISWLIYHHLYKTSAAGDWDEIKKYDLNGNGMIDLADIVALWSLIGK